MDRLLLFVDGSVDTILNIGYGAYLAVDECELSSDSAATEVKVKRFSQTSSTKLELQTLIWALVDLREIDRKIVIYTDSQNIIGLPGRRDRLESKNFHSSTNKLLNNHDLYREFYLLTDQIDCELVKVKGHLPTKQKNYIDRLFAKVDKAARQSMKRRR